MFEVFFVNAPEAPNIKGCIAASLSEPADAPGVEQAQLYKMMATA
jgi:hypothetical protein